MSLCSATSLSISPRDPSSSQYREALFALLHTPFFKTTQKQLTLNNSSSSPSSSSSSSSSSSYDDSNDGIGLEESHLISSMEFHLEDPLVADPPSSLFLIESSHMPSGNYAGSLKVGDFDVVGRREIVASISHLCSGLDRLVPYLSVNYLDRFLSSQKLPQTKPWTVRLIAMSCVSLAAKMRGVAVSLSDLQGNGGLVFDSETVQRMEVLILGALKWRMRSITPFSFVAFFVSMFELEDVLLRQALKGRATEIIFRAQTDTNLLGFKPSTVAASALLWSSNELSPLHFSSFREAISNCSYVNKDHLEQCYDQMQRVAADGYGSVHDSVSRSDTPSNVLDQHFGSTSDSEMTGLRALKRRKTTPA